MNIELIASDLANRIPEMARDSALNNYETIKGIIRQHSKPQPDPLSASNYASILNLERATIWGFIIITSLLALSQIQFARHMDKYHQPSASKIQHTPQYTTNVITLTNYVSNGEQWADIGFKDGTFYGFYSLSQLPGIASNSLDFEYRARKLKAHAKLMSQNWQTNHP